METDKLIEMANDLIVVYGLKLVTAVIVLIIGLWIIRMIKNGMGKVLLKRKIDQSLTPYVLSLLSTSLKALLIISVMSMMGVEMTSFIAILGAAGLAVGLALSGTLQNFAGGVMILIFKPFKVGDFVTMAGHSGTVKEIQIFNTILKTPDNKTIIIPNNEISGASIINFSTEPTRRVDMTFGIGYSDDIDKTRKTLNEIISTDERIIPEPAPFIAVSELADSSVNFVVRVWVNAPDYWGVFFDTQEKVKKTFDEKGIGIPFPQRDVHIYNHK